MERLKKSKLTERQKGIVWLLVMVSPLLLLMIYQVNKRNELLKDYSVTEARVYKVSLNRRKGKNFASYKYIFKGKTYDSRSEFGSSDVKEGDVFEIKVSNIDPTVRDIDFSKKIIKESQ